MLGSVNFGAWDNIILIVLRDFFRLSSIISATSSKVSAVIVAVYVVSKMVLKHYLRSKALDELLRVMLMLSSCSLRLYKTFCEISYICVFRVVLEVFKVIFDIFKENFGNVLH